MKSEFDWLKQSIVFQVTCIDKKLRVLANACMLTDKKRRGLNFCVFSRLTDCFVLLIVASEYKKSGRKGSCRRGRLKLPPSMASSLLSVSLIFFVEGNFIWVFVLDGGLAFNGGIQGTALSASQKETLCDN